MCISWFIYNVIFRFDCSFAGGDCFTAAECIKKRFPLQ